MSTKAETFRRQRRETMTPGEGQLYDKAMEAFQRAKNIEGMSHDEALAACDKVITEGLPEVEAEDNRMEAWLTGASNEGDADGTRRGSVPRDSDDPAE